MKNLLSTIVLAGMIALNTSAQTQPQNAGFENWEVVGTVAEDPVDWSSGNEFEAFGVPVLIFKTTDMNTGSFALKLISDTATVPPPMGTGVLDTVAGMVNLGGIDFNNPGLPFTGRPAEMKVFVKGTIGAGDICFIGVELWKWNTGTNQRDQVGSALYTMNTSIANYTEQTTAFNYSLPDTPDTLSIMIVGGNIGPGGTVIPGNEFFVDDISFTGTVGIKEMGKNISINIYPNPVKNEINITTSFNENALFNIYDILGKQIKSVKLNGEFTKVSTDELSDGTYIYQIVNKKGVVINKGEFNVIK